MLNFRVSSTLFAAALTLLPAAAQESSVGVALPMTLTAGWTQTHRLQALDPDAKPFAASGRAMLYPTLRLGEKWLAYSALQVELTPSYYYDAYYSSREIELEVVQAFVAYTPSGPGWSASWKTGRLVSAFGAFPPRYDDAQNALLDQPLNYTSPVRLRADQMPCGVKDLLHQRAYPLYVHHYCGGSKAESNGMVPVTLYGLPGTEFDFTLHRMDARFQMTNSSPANPQGLGSRSQSLQWTAGAGYTLRRGLRAGFSAFRGAYLDQAVATSLPSGFTTRDFPATAVGIDMQWAKGRWSANGEWQQFQFTYPRFQVSPKVTLGYAEVKVALNPRFYMAARAGYQGHNRVQDQTRTSEESFSPNRSSYELAAGYRINRFQLLKVGYEWVHTVGGSLTRDNVFGVQLVTSIHSLSKSFK